VALDQNTLNKIILLKIVSLLPGLRQNMLADAAVDSLQMNFIEYSLALSELRDNKLLYQAVRKGEPHLDSERQAVERVDITTHGLEVLQALENQIPLSVSKWINNKATELSGIKNKEESYSARINLTGSGEWLLVLERYESDNISFRIDLIFPSKDLAEKAASAWEAASLELYDYILTRLLAD